MGEGKQGMGERMRGAESRVGGGLGQRVGEGRAGQWCPLPGLPDDLSTSDLSSACVNWFSTCSPQYGQVPKLPSAAATSQGQEVQPLYPWDSLVLRGGSECAWSWLLRLPVALEEVLEVESEDSGCRFSKG